MVRRLKRALENRRGKTSEEVETYIYETFLNIKDEQKVNDFKKILIFNNEIKIILEYEEPEVILNPIGEFQKYNILKDFKIEEI